MVPAALDETLMADEHICRWCFLPLSEEESLCQDCTEKEAMLKEGLTTAPELLERADFDRFLWKLAVYAIKTMEHPEGGTRWTLEHLRNSLMVAVVEALPLDYVSVTKKWLKEAKPGEPAKEVVFTLKKAVPKVLLYKTIERLGIWTPTQKEDGDDFAGA